MTNAATNTTLNTKINEVKNKIPIITILATTTTTAVIAVANKIPDHNKYIITPEFNKLTAENVTTRLAQANLASKNDIVNFVKKIDFDDTSNVTSNKTKHVLVENELNKLSKKVKAISTKGLTKDLMNGYKILNPIQDGLFRGCSRMGDLAHPP